MLVVKLYSDVFAVVNDLNLDLKDLIDVRIRCRRSYLRRLKIDFILFIVL